ncbi:MAG: cation:proton antiporter [Nanoarchaeota archaeon]|nr:cation:proton antiporter [Nanoarchaeota archaeon]MBU1501338.1 cation:proton antiporter [Nanoarchaeota archaeon]MBU2459317.1 cation:proton antiporter [Nanoarchaeota archaeon]
MVEVFTQISFMILIVLGVSLIMKLLKQPMIIGYILSGIIVGPYFLGILPGIDTINTFSEIGIALLLFIVGLHLTPKVIKEVGRISLITGIGQIIFTCGIGYLIAVTLGFPILTSLYIGMALAFSSTIIIMKLLSDKGDLYTLYGKISIGFLLVQDLVAILILMIISSLSSGENFVSQIAITILKGILLTLVLGVISVFILPRFQKFFASAQEFLFVFSIAWGLGIASLFFYAGLSIEVGALIAGVLLSISPYNYEISSKMKPLRDFFIISFFLLLGAQMTIGYIPQLLLPAIIFSLFVLIGNPLIVMILMGIEGFTKKTGFLAGLTVAQISEFSLILIVLGVKVGHISNEILSLITLVGMITIAGTTYMVLYGNKIYRIISDYLQVFEKKKVKERKIKYKKVDAILFGYNRIGFGILNSLKKIKKNYLVVDFNPEVVADLKKMRVPCIYGDVDDDALLRDLPLKTLKLAVSTIPDFETNDFLIETIKEQNPKTIVIVRAHTIEDAMDLYKSGADYVLTPHFLGGEYLAGMLKDIKTDREGYKEEKEKHIKMLMERFKRGHEHPDA